jgi:hypothetical protein
MTKIFKAFAILFFFLFASLEANAQSIVGTWHSTGMLMLSESAKEQKLIITKDSIHILSTRDLYNYTPTDDTTNYNGYQKIHSGDTTEVNSIKTVSIIPDKMTDRGYMLIITPTFASSKAKPTYTAMRYIFVDDDHCKLAVAVDQEFKSKKEIEKVYTGLKYQDIFYLVSEKKNTEYLRMKNAMNVTVDDVLSIMKDVHDYVANYAARVDKEKNENLMIELMSGVSERISQSLEVLGYNPIITMDDVEEIMKKYQDDPRVTKISNDIEQIMENN